MYVCTFLVCTLNGFVIYFLFCRQSSWRRLPSGLGSVLSLFPHALHPEVAELPASPAAVPYVSSGVEVQRVTLVDYVYYKDGRFTGILFFLPPVNRRVSCLFNAVDIFDIISVKFVIK